MNPFIHKLAPLGFLISILMITLSSCHSDDDLQLASVSDEYTAQAKEVLSGNVVLSMRTFIGDVDMTRLETGCPTKFSFTWQGDEVEIRLIDFHVANMPFIINFQSKARLYALNSWEQKEYKGSGWVKIYGTNGLSKTADRESKPLDQKQGAVIKGYYNVLTHEINMNINFNMMNVYSDCFLQKVDKHRIDRYDEEVKQYQADLVAYKKQKGEL